MGNYSMKPIGSEAMHLYMRVCQPILYLVNDCSTVVWSVLTKPRESQYNVNQNWNNIRRVYESRCSCLVASFATEQFN